MIAGCKDEPGPGIGDVTDEPARYYGKEVTLSGHVQRVQSDRSFVLESKGFWDNEILVLTKTPIRGTGAIALDQGDEVRVTGTVQKLTVAEVERDLGWDLDTTLEVEYKDKAVLVARSISFLREEGRWQEGSGLVGMDQGEGRQPAGVQAGQGPESDLRGGPVVVAIIVAVIDPAPLVGKTVELVRAPVQQTAGDKAFWIGDSPRQRLLVVMEGERSEGASKWTEGKSVDITGTVQRMPPAAEAARRWGLDQGALENQRLYIQAQRVTESREQAPAGVEQPGSGTQQQGGAQQQQGG